MHFHHFRLLIISTDCHFVHYQMSFFFFRFDWIWLDQNHVTIFIRRSTNQIAVGKDDKKAIYYHVWITKDNLSFKIFDGEHFLKSLTENGKKIKQTKTFTVIWYAPIKVVIKRSYSRCFRQLFFKRWRMKSNKNHSLTHSLTHSLAIEISILIFLLMKQLLSLSP